MNTTKNMQIKNLYILLVADFISSFGALMISNAITLIVFQRSGDLLTTALLSFAVLVPKTAMTPFVGKIKIGLSFRRIFCLGEIICGLVLGTLLISDNLIMILVMNIIHGIAFLVLECYRAEFLKIVSDEKSMYRYQGISRMVNVAVTVIAPLVSGAILSYVASARVIYAVAVGMYFFAACIILLINGEIFPVKDLSEEVREKVKLKSILRGRGYIFAGSSLVNFVGGITSLLTLTYIVSILHLGEFQYSVLMSLMSLGSFIGSACALFPAIQKRLRAASAVSTALMGFLLLSVLCVPGFYPLCGICLVSGILSSVIMVFYSMEFYVQYDECEIRSASAYFEACTNISSMVAKPIAGFLERSVGAVWGLMSMGLLFSGLAVGNGFDSVKKSRMKAGDLQGKEVEGEDEICRDL